MAVCSCALLGFTRAQAPNNVETQSPRQAVLEMFSGDDAAFKKHLTVEMQAKLNDLATSASPASPGLFAEINAVRMASAGQMEKFDSGPVLFAFHDPKENERLEIHFDGDDLRAEEQEDIMLLSVHLYRAGVEQELPAEMHFLLGLKLQQNVWRLNDVTVNAKVPVGDPRVLDKSWWVPPAIGPLAALQAQPVSVATPTPTPAPAEDRPLMPVARAIRLIGLAENIYAAKHPQAGFTCAMSELIGVGKELDNGRTSTFLGPEFAGGVYNGYRFAFSGCAGNPVTTFRITAEPMSGAGRAYCSDATQQLRASDDDRAATCLASGKPLLP